MRTQLTPAVITQMSSTKEKLTLEAVLAEVVVDILQEVPMEEVDIQLEVLQEVVEDIHQEDQAVEGKCSQTSVIMCCSLLKFVKIKKSCSFHDSKHFWIRL